MLLNSCQGCSKLDNWGADIHIFVFTHHKNKRFEKTEIIVHNMNIKISVPYLSSLLRSCVSIIYFGIYIKQEIDVFIRVIVKIFLSMERWNVLLWSIDHFGVTSHMTNCVFGRHVGGKTKNNKNVFEKNT